MSQREMMRRLIAIHGLDETSVCGAYAAAEEAGIIQRDSNTHDLTAAKYAHALWHDALRKRWY
jgi:hypothetical protein